MMQNNLVEEALHILHVEGVRPELRNAKEIIQEVVDIGGRLSKRWKKRREHLEWEAEGCHGSEPQFFDHLSKETRSARFALSPCPLVNHELDHLVSIVLGQYGPSTLDDIIDVMKTDQQVAQHIEDIRNISIYSEEGMEQEALQLVFKMVDRHKTTYKTLVKEFIKPSKLHNNNNNNNNNNNKLHDNHNLSDTDSGVSEDSSENDDDDDDDEIEVEKNVTSYPWKNLSVFDDVAHRYLMRMKDTIKAFSNNNNNNNDDTNNNLFLSVDQEERIMTLHVLVVDLIHHLQALHPSVYKGMVFKYFDNYLFLVVGELQLLATPLLIKTNTKGESVVVTPAHIPNLLDALHRGEDLEKGWDKAVSTGMNQFERVSTNYYYGSTTVDLSSKIFTFVGAGFPLTGVILHVMTHARINLVDCDSTVVEGCRRFLEIVEELGVVEVGSIRVYHARGEDLLYRSPSMMSTTKSTKSATTTAPTISESSSNSTKRDLSKSARNQNSQQKSTKISSTIHPTKNSSADDCRVVIPTDILDIASAIPQSVTMQILMDNAKDVAVVRKRNTRGMSEIMYENFTLQTAQQQQQQHDQQQLKQQQHDQQQRQEQQQQPKRCGFELVLEVSPPQKLVSEATPECLGCGILSHINLNSCQLYLNTELLQHVVKK